VPDFVIKTTFRGADRLSPTLKRLGIRVDQVGDKATRSFRQASRAATGFGTVMKGILAAGVVQRGLAAAGMAVRELGEEFIAFDKNTTKAVTRLPGGLDRTSAAFAEMGAIARREAARTEFSAAQTSGAIEQLALAGFNLEQSMAALPGTINLATNANVAVEEATTIAAKSLGAFGLKVDDTAQLTQNLTRVNDVFSRTVSGATLDITGLFETLKFGGPAAHAAGQSIETFSAVTGVLADSAIDASIAGTSLRRAFLNLAAPVPKARKELKRLGVSIKDATTGEFRDFLAIMKDVETATKDMTNVQKLSSLSTIFGARAVNAMNAILVRGVDNVVDFRTNLEKAGGASKKMADTIRQSLGNRLLILRSALIELGFKFLEAFAGKAGEGVEGAIKAVQKFDVKPVVDGVKDVLRWSKELFDTIRPVLRWLPELIGLWVAYKAALVAVTTIQAVTFFVKLASGIKAAAAAQGILNLVMLANPIGLLTAAVFALIVALGILVTNYDEIVAGWEESFINMEITARKFWVGLKNMAAGAINSVLDIVTALPKAFGKILGIDTADLQFGRVDFVTDADLAGIKEAEARLKGLREESAGLGVARGAAPISDAAGAFERQLAADLAIPGDQTVFGPAQAAAQIAAQNDRAARAAVDLLLGQGGVEPPNQAEAQARIDFNGRITFENAPVGMSFETETSGAPPVDVEGLGGQ
jgi:TP901 family phage tail tape measure protein